MFISIAVTRRLPALRSAAVVGRFLSAAISRVTVRIGSCEPRRERHQIPLRTLGDDFIGDAFGRCAVKRVAEIVEGRTSSRRG